MPTYEYECTACDHAFERFESISAKPDNKCPLCGKRKAKRCISAGGGLIFKGSGFYTTDYRSSSYKSDASSDTKSGTKTESSSKKSTDSKTSTSSKKKESTAASS